MNKNLFGLNPKFKDFIEKRPDITLMGIFWSSYWRFTVVVLGVYVILAILFFILFSIIYFS
jgi:hypothetical protein